jgi:hypothetical protein
MYFVSKVSYTSTSKAYLADKDQEVKIETRSEGEALFILVEAVHRLGIR